MSAGWTSAIFGRVGEGALDWVLEVAPTMRADDVGGVILVRAQECTLVYILWALTAVVEDQARGAAAICVLYVLRAQELQHASGASRAHRHVSCAP
jgi:hypothetical protein